MTQRLIQDNQAESARANRSLQGVIPDRNGLKRQSFCDPSSRFALAGMTIREPNWRRLLRLRLQPPSDVLTHKERERPVLRDWLPETWHCPKAIAIRGISDAERRVSAKGGHCSRNCSRSLPASAHDGATVPGALSAIGDDPPDISINPPRAADTDSGPKR